MRTPQRESLVGVSAAVLSALVVALVASGIVALEVSREWGRCLVDVERYGFVWWPATASCVVLNAVCFSLAGAGTCVAARLLLPSGSVRRGVRVAVSCTAVGAVLLVLVAVAVHVEFPVMYHLAPPQDLTRECGGTSPLPRVR